MCLCEFEAEIPTVCSLSALLLSCIFHLLVLFFTLLDLISSFIFSYISEFKNLSVYSQAINIIIVLYMMPYILETDDSFHMFNLNFQSKYSC